MFACFASVTVQAQLDPSMYLRYKELKTPDTTQLQVPQIIAEAVKPALSIVRQQYRLERNGEFYGKNKRAFYGETYTLGVKISNSTLLQRGVILPWENDPDYKRVNAGGEYMPTYYRSLQRRINSMEWKDVEFVGTQFTKPTTADSLLFLNQDKIADFGLPEDETEGLKHGYLIWAYSTTNLQDSSMQVKLQSSNFQVNVKSDSASIKVKPENTENLLGGIFVVPTVERAGYIKLSLVGVATQMINNEWVLKLLIKKDGEVTKVGKPEKAEKQKKKRNKNEPGTSSKETLDESEPTPIK